MSLHKKTTDKSKAEIAFEELAIDPEFSRAFTDPVFFSQIILNIEPRWYQKIILRDDGNKKVIRCGRRIGKCVYSESEILTENGPISVEKLYNSNSRPAIITFNEKSQEMVSTDFYTVMDNGTKPVYKITTKTGRINYATGNHPYLTFDNDGKFGWVDIDHMKIGDRIAVPATYEGFVTGKPVGSKIARLLGYLTGDGNTSQQYVSVSNIDNGVLDDLNNIADNFDCELKDYNNTDDYRIVTKIPKHNKVIRLANKHGLLGKLAVEKEVPQAIKAGTENDVANFLSAYWDCDGWCSIQSKTYDSSHKSPRVEVGVGMSSERLAYDIQHLLLRLGIVSYIRDKKVKYSGSYRKAWQVTIGDRKNIKKFAKKIDLRSSKKENLDKILSLLKEKKYCGNKYINTIPKAVWPYIKSRQKELNLTNADVCRTKDNNKNERLRAQYSVSRNKINTYASNLNDEYLKKLANNNILWDKIESIEYVGERQTYDLSVSNTHTFISNDIISHNTYSMILKILYSIYTNENFKVLVVGPLGIQVDQIFDDLRQIINNNEMLKASVVRSVKSPQRIELTNGSVVLGLSAGTTSGSGAKSIRGQGANLIVLDECDFLSEADINSIMGMSLQDMGNIEIWSASTPTGARTMYYSWCQKSNVTYTINNLKELKPVKKKRRKGNGWHQFHFPSHVHPNWDSEMESELRGMFSEIGFIHEVLAEFGDTEAGVYKNKYIEESIYDYSYEDMQMRYPQPRRARIIGVDWDKLHPTQIVVSEFDPDYEKIRLIDRIEIEHAEFTFDKAVEKIIELDRKYQPEFIYCDRGYGEYQVEVLKKKLGKKVKGIQFSEKIEVRDPVDKTVDKKETKHFMVTQTSILLERNQLMFSRTDNEFLDQLRNYRIVKYTTSGKPIYNDDDEHAHDGFALTVLAFNQEYPDLAKLLEKNRVARIIKFVNKRLEPSGDKSMFNGEGGEYGFNRKQEEEMDGEPQYVKHMKSIEFARKRGGSLRLSSLGSRGSNSKPPGRGSF